MKACAARVTCALALLLAGCAGPGGPAISDDTPGVQRGNALTPQAAQAAAPRGQSQAGVAAALGPATVVRFASGYALWVYRWPGADLSSRGATELVILFDPSGRVAKTRVRPGYAPASR